MQVSAFIDPTSSSWKSELLNEFFLPMDSEAIQAIPLSTRRRKD
jgi:hypothetical protein